VAWSSPVDPHEHQVLVVELEIEPRPPVRDHPGRVQELAARVFLALVVAEEHPGRPVELVDDDPLGPVDDERAVLGHHRDLTEVHLLLLHVPDAAGARGLVHVPHHEPHRDLERPGVGHAPLEALLHRVTRLTQLVLHELQGRRLREVLDGEHALEHPLQAHVAPLLGRHVGLEEPGVGLPLDLDQVGDPDHGLDFVELPAEPSVVGHGIRHGVPSPSHGRMVHRHRARFWPGAGGVDARTGGRSKTKRGTRRAHAPRAPPSGVHRVRPFATFALRRSRPCPQLPRSSSGFPRPRPCSRPPSPRRGRCPPGPWPPSGPGP